MVRRTRNFSKSDITHSAYSLNLILFNESLGDSSDDGTPGHIPNPVVKLVSADGTWGATPWESRSLPRDFFI